MFGPEVGVVVESLGFIEHVLPPQTFVEARDGDAGRQIEALRFDRFGQADRTPSALDVGLKLFGRTGGHVVDGSEVEEVAYLIPQFLAHFVADAQVWLGEVADDGDDLPVETPLFDAFTQAVE